MAKTVVGIDTGATAVRALELRLKGDTIQVLGYRVDEEGAANPAAALRAFGLKGKTCVPGLGGRDIRLHYAQVPPVPDWQLQNLVAFEVQEISSQSGQELCADFNLLPGSSELTGEDTVLIAMTRAETAGNRQAWVEGVGGTLESLCPNPVALYNAALVAGEVREGETLLVANLGHQTMDVVLLNGADILFARNLSGGGKVFDEAISQTFNVRGERARKIKLEFVNVDPTARDRYASSQEEKVSRAVLGAAGQLVSALRSTVAFCQSQTGLRELKIDRILLCGGTSRTKGLRQLLNENFRCPVDRLDPFTSGVVDLGGLAKEEKEDLLEETAEAVLALGLAVGAAKEELYRVEILPDKLRQRREFMGGPLFAVGAALVALVFLVVYGVLMGDRYRELEETAGSLRRRASRLETTHKSAERQLENNGKMLARIRAYEDLGGRGVSLHRTWQVLERILPEDLWLASVTVDKKSPSRKDAFPTPMITIKGLGVPTGQDDLNLVFTRFLGELERATGIKPVPEIRAPIGDKDKFSFTVTLDYFVGRPEPTGEAN